MLFFLLTWSATLAIAAVTVNIPIEDQLAPTARIDKLYSWSFFEDSFLSNTNATLVYSASSLPKWLTFDPASRSFHGTPSETDEGHPEITITANESNDVDSASSTFSFCVSKYSAPPVNIPITDQFIHQNPSLSSVFLLANDSALSTPNPALRIPPAWSFSIGIESNTFGGSHSIHYAALQADGSPLPSWIRFNTKTITFNGFTPSVKSADGPLVLSLAIHATDNDGYSAAALPFDVVVASHELRSTHSLPTINVTASTQFNTSLNSALDFSGVLVDTDAIQAANISSLSIDVSRYQDWLRYDANNRQLSGNPPESLQVGAILSFLPVTITSSFGQTAHTNVSIAIVPSYFTAESLTAMTVKTGKDIYFNLAEYLSNPSRPSDADLSAAFDPEAAAEYLRFNNSTDELTGKLPASVNYDHIQVTFTAYSRITHSTSHTRLRLSVDGKKPQNLDPVGLPSKSKSKLVLGVGIAFAVIGGIFLLLVSLALCRRWGRVRDTALEGEAGRKGWTEKEKKWYGLEAGIEADEEKMVVNFRNAPADLGVRKYGSLGLGTRSPVEGLPPVMKKAEFFDKLRSTVRAVSDKYRSINVLVRPSRPRLIIGKPTPASHQRASASVGMGIVGAPISFSIDGSLSSSSQAPSSVPTRRADFAPPSRSPLSSHHNDTNSIEQLADSSASSTRSSRSSTEIHAHEAVVHTARALSVRSGKSVSFPYPPQTSSSGKPRLVPFTNSSRVPVPKIPSRETSSAGHSCADKASVHRVMSLTAEVEDEKVQSDELDAAMNYVRAFGSDLIEKEPRSFYSLESSHGSAVTRGDSGAPRFLARVGERFLFTICVTELDRPEVRLVSGDPLPSFLRVNIRSGNARGTVQVWGTPENGDIGEVNIGVYDREDGHCLGRAIAEIVAHA